jgi:transposase
VPHSMCGSGARWCARADAIFDVPNMHVLEVEVDSQQRLVLTVESGRLEAPCPTCGVLAVGHGRRARMLHDVPCLQGHPAAMAGADLALPRTCVSGQHVQ